MTHPAGIYISVPFCKAKCSYCNFASGVFAPGRMDRYVERVCHEIRNARSEWSRLHADVPQSIDSIFFGGGTPSLLSAAHMQSLFAALRAEFDIEPTSEITLECAPGQLAADTLDELLRHGMNRISFGVQSFVDREAAAVGRLHTRALCLSEIDRLRDAGIRNINLDLIVGLPHQTAESWRESVGIAIATGVPHLSVYMLEVDEDSRLGREMLAEGGRYGASAAPTEDETAAWYAAACTWLESAGVHQYEISNFARAGHTSRHNTKYWRRQPYLGFGLDAHSMLRRGPEALRRANTDDLDTYLHQPPQSPPTGLQVITTEAAPKVDLVRPEQGFEEALFLGLRMNEGVDLADLRTEFGDGLVRCALEATADVEQAGLLSRIDGRLQLTAQGRMVSNEVFSRLLLTPA